MVESTYQRHLSLTGEPIAAALLTLAEAIEGKPTKATALTVKQAGDVLGISERVVRDLVATNQLGHHRVGNGRGQVRILPRDIEEYQSRDERRPVLRHLGRSRG